MRSGNRLEWPGFCREKQPRQLSLSGLKFFKRRIIKTTRGGYGRTDMQDIRHTRSYAVNPAFYEHPVIQALADTQRWTISHENSFQPGGRPARLSD